MSYMRDLYQTLTYFSRRDGSSFLNLLMHAPLYDHTGKVRYFMGAQLDVSSAIEESTELESVSRTVKRLDRQNSPRGKNKQAKEGDKDNEFQQLVEMLDMQELKAVRTWEERMLQETPEAKAESDRSKSQRPDMLSRVSTSASMKIGSSPPLDLAYLHGLYTNVSPLFSLPSLAPSPPPKKNQY